MMMDIHNRKDGHHSNLETVLGQEMELGMTSQLNPRFVVEMMGYPIDWLTLPFQSGETKV
jgi:hypothetical protein